MPIDFITECLLGSRHIHFFIDPWQRPHYFLHCHMQVVQPINASGLLSARDCIGTAFVRNKFPIMQSLFGGDPHRQN